MPYMFIHIYIYVCVCVCIYICMYIRNTTKMHKTMETAQLLNSFWKLFFSLAIKQCTGFTTEQNSSIYIYNKANDDEKVNLFYLKFKIFILIIYKLNKYLKLVFTLNYIYYIIYILYIYYYIIYKYYILYYIL